MFICLCASQQEYTVVSSVGPLVKQYSSVEYIVIMYSILYVQFPHNDVYKYTSSQNVCTRPYLHSLYLRDIEEAQRAPSPLQETLYIIHFWNTYEHESSGK